jgi:hypothetical protein
VCVVCAIGVAVRLTVILVGFIVALSLGVAF